MSGGGIFPEEEEQERGKVSLVQLPTFSLTVRRRSRAQPSTNTLRSATSVFGGNENASDSESNDDAAGGSGNPPKRRRTAPALFTAALKQTPPPPSEPTPPPPAEEPAEIDPLDAFMNEMNSRKTAKTGAGAGGGTTLAVEYAEQEEIENRTQDVQDDPNAQSFLARNRKKKLVYEKVDHSKIEYHSFRKDLYIEVPELARMSLEEVGTLRKSLGNIGIRGKRCPKPIVSWGQCGLSSVILAEIRRCGYVAPTPIQAQAIPAIMTGRDVIGVARTGSGKTLAFVLPTLRHVGVQHRAHAGDGPVALIIAPTRELTLQIYGETKRFAKLLKLRVVCAYGGSGVKDQITELKRGADVVVATPGRLIDLLAMNSGRITNLRRTTFVVLDEADRMFDLGFEPQLTRVVENVRPDRQTVMFSATFPRKVEELARRILKSPVEITVGGNSVAAATIDQHVEVRTEDSKFFRLLELLGVWYERGSTLVFVDRQESADRIFSDLSKAKYQCLPLHAGRDQADRDSAIADFKQGDVKILVATSVAARGLDVKHLSLVVNYDVPNHYEDYVHRVGRTGRAGRPGTAYTFVTPEQESYAPDLVKALSLSARAAANARSTAKSEDERRQIADEAAAAAVPNDLRALAEAFERKRKAGIVVHGRNSGYGGKGFSFDGNRKHSASQMQLRKAQAKRYVAEHGDDIDDEEESSDDDVEVREIGPGAGGSDSASVSATAGSAPAPATEKEVLAAIAKAKVEAITRQARGESVVPTPAAEDVVGTADKQKFAAELEINDYPQHARWQVTRKNALADVEEFTSCVVTNRGNFYPQGRNPPKGQRKLHLLIEGPSVPAVKSARREIKRKLEEAALARPGEDAYSKYSVV